MTKYKYAVVIPARGGSKRLPRKNILPLNGKPLLAHSIIYAQKEMPQMSVYVSTDSEEIAKIAIQYGAKVITRPLAESSDNASTGDVLRHALLWLDANDEKYDYLITLQPTNPLRPDGMMRNAIELVDRIEPSSLTTVSPILRKQGRVINNKFIPVNYKFGMRSQDMETWYYENGLLYFTSRDVALSRQTITPDVYPLSIDHLFAQIDIDTKNDFKMAEFFMNEIK